MNYKVDKTTLSKKLREVVGWARQTVVPADRAEDATYEIGAEVMDAARSLEVASHGWHRAVLALVMGCIAEEQEAVQDKAAEDRECKDLIAEKNVDDADETDRDDRDGEHSASEDDDQ